jgi:hypothetical protein
MLKTSMKTYPNLRGNIMPAYLKSIFNYSSKNLRVENTQTNKHWDVAPNVRADGNDDVIPWVGSGHLEIKTDIGEVWNIDDGDWNIWITVPGQGRNSGAKYPGSINQAYNLDFYEQGPTITWI